MARHVECSTTRSVVWEDSLAETGLTFRESSCLPYDAKRRTPM